MQKSSYMLGCCKSGVYVSKLNWSHAMTRKDRPLRQVQQPAFVAPFQQSTLSSPRCSGEEGHGTRACQASNSVAPHVLTRWLRASNFFPGTASAGCGSRFAVGLLNQASPPNPHSQPLSQGAADLGDAPMYRDLLDNTLLRDLLKKYLLKGPTKMPPTNLHNTRFTRFFELVGICKQTLFIEIQARTHARLPANWDRAGSDLPIGKQTFCLHTTRLSCQQAAERPIAL